MALNSLGRASKCRVSMTALVERIAGLLDHTQFLVHHVLKLLTHHTNNTQFLVPEAPETSWKQHSVVQHILNLLTHQRHNSQFLVYHVLKLLTHHKNNTQFLVPKTSWKQHSVTGPPYMKLLTHTHTTLVS